MRGNAGKAQQAQAKRGWAGKRNPQPMQLVADTGDKYLRRRRGPRDRRRSGDRGRRRPSELSGRPSRLAKTRARQFCRARVFCSLGQGRDSSGSLSSPVVCQFNRNPCMAGRSHCLRTRRGLAAFGCLAALGCSSPRSSILARARTSNDASLNHLERRGRDAELEPDEAVGQPSGEDPIFAGGDSASWGW